MDSDSDYEDYDNYVPMKGYSGFSVSDFSGLDDFLSDFNKQSVAGPILVDCDNEDSECIVMDEYEVVPEPLIQFASDKAQIDLPELSWEDYPKSHFDSLAVVLSTGLDTVTGDGEHVINSIEPLFFGEKEVNIIARDVERVEKSYKLKDGKLTEDDSIISGLTTKVYHKENFVEISLDGQDISFPVTDVEKLMWLKNTSGILIREDLASYRLMKERLYALRYVKGNFVSLEGDVIVSIPGGRYRTVQVLKERKVYLVTKQGRVFERHHVVMSTAECLARDANPVLKDFVEVMKYMKGCKAVKRGAYPGARYSEETDVVWDSKINFLRKRVGWKIVKPDLVPKKDRWTYDEFLDLLHVNNHLAFVQKEILRYGLMVDFDIIKRWLRSSSAVVMRNRVRLMSRVNPPDELMKSEGKILIHSGIAPLNSEMVYLDHIKEELLELYSAPLDKWYTEAGDLMMGIIKCTQLYGADKVIHFIWSMDEMSDSREKFENRLAKWETLDRTSIVTPSYFRTIYNCGLAGSIEKRLTEHQSDAALKWLESNHMLGIEMAKIAASYDKKKICDHGIPLTFRPEGWNLSVKGGLKESKFERDLDDRIIKGQNLNEIKFNVSAKEFVPRHPEFYSLGNQVKMS